jgi:hypothetical protein
MAETACRVGDCPTRLALWLQSPGLSADRAQLKCMSVAGVSTKSAGIIRMNFSILQIVCGYEASVSLATACLWIVEY